MTVDAHSCLDAHASDIYHVVAVELDAQLVSASDATPGTTRVSIRCHQTVADIVVLDPTTGKIVARSIDLSTAPVPGRARLLALATVELVSASWAELEGSVPRSTTRLGVQASASERAAARSAAARRELRRPTLRGSLGPQLLVPLSQSPLLAGADLRLAGARSGLGWSASLAMARGAIDDPLGDLSLLTASASAGLGWRVDCSGWASSFEITGRVGGSFWNAEAREPTRVDAHDFSAPFAAAGLLASVERALSARLSLQLLLSAEQVVMPVYVKSAGVRAHGLDGRWLGVGLGSSFAF